MSAVFDARHAHTANFRKHGAWRGAGFAIAVGLHAVTFAAIMLYAPAREVLRSAAPIMVEFITPPRIERVRPEPAKPAPPPHRPIVKQVEHPVEPPAVLATPTQAQAPSPMAVAAPPTAPPQPEPVRAGPPAVVAVSTPPPVTQPIFSADYLDNPAPAYPPFSRRLGEQGRVVLRVLVSAKGAADEVSVRTSSGFARLDDAARNSVQRWKFVPARRGSDAVPAWVLIPISFRLES